ncbi:MAG: PD-(D/E)XK nuclease family protein [Candidatus Bathyarchaeia archaeon]
MQMVLFDVEDRVRKLGCSQLGERCERKLLLLSYGFSGRFRKHVLRVMEVGKLLEPLVVKWLMEDGYRVMYPEREREVDFAIKVGGGYVVGRYDLLIFEDDEIVVSDIKVVSLESCYKARKFDFDRWREDPFLCKYLVQLHGYVWGLRQVNLPLFNGLSESKAKLVLFSRENLSYWIVDLEVRLDWFEQEILERVKRVFSYGLIDGLMRLDFDNRECEVCEFSVVCGF